MISTTYYYGKGFSVKTELDFTGIVKEQNGLTKYMTFDKEQIYDLIRILLATVDINEYNKHTSVIRRTQIDG